MIGQVFPPGTTFGLSLSGAVVPKARPRHHGNQSYLPARYRGWKNGAIAELRTQYRGEPLSGVGASVLLQGKGHRLNGDLDNLAGSCLDAMVGAGILQDDSLKHVWKLVVECDRTSLVTQVRIVLLILEE